MEVDSDSATPLYEQVAAVLRDQIRSGQIAKDRPLPSVKQLQQIYGVAQGTAERAIRILKEEKLVRSVIGKGVYVI
jgi:DNA-binding GntR family transcriptional regulator